MHVPLIQAGRQSGGRDHNKHFGLRVFLVATFVATAFTGPALAANHPTSRSRHHVDQRELLSWLPADTESVVAAEGPFRLLFPSCASENEDTTTVSKAEIFLQFEQQPLEILYSLRDVEPLLRGSTVAFAIQGSRHFRDPLPGLEVMEFEGSSIVVFDNTFGERGNVLMQALANKATETTIVGETQVLAFRHEAGDAEWHSFLALPRPNVLLAANNLPYLQEVLERMRQRMSPRALPDELPEWRFLLPDTRFWGLRHYDRTQADQDLTSPLGPDRTFPSRDEKAIGIVFALDPDNHKKAVTTYLSGDDAKVRAMAERSTRIEKAEIGSCDHEIITRDGGQSLEDPNPEEGVNDVEILIPGPGIIKRTYNLDGACALGYFILSMRISLGRGMFF